MGSDPTTPINASILNPASMLSLTNLRSETGPPAGNEVLCDTVGSAGRLFAGTQATPSRISPLPPSSLVPTFIVLFLVFLISVSPAHAQGCAQCLDSTRATPPAVQAAYRHAIYLLIGVASTIFLIGLYLLRREP